MTPILPALVALAAGQPEPLPQVVVDRDNVVITQSCRVTFPDGVLLEDGDNNGVIHVEADGITIEWPAERPGREMLARGGEGAFETMAGIGVRIDGHRNVTIRGAHVHRYRIGIWATNADGLTLEGCDVSDGYAMRLGSTPAAEDSADWLWPHNNDRNEWATNYGAGIWIEDSANVTVARCFARRRQNALLLENVTDSRIYDNDFSFLSGWGIAMWRSSRNTITRNALDFCIRGYSHGVYNRGQDSAGILLFEQCNANLFAENSATHGGDGLFGFGGKEALGDTPAPATDADGKPWSYTRRGCNDNVFVGNDFSYAAAHGLELTFSFGNIIVNNRFVENAICGIWGGYSQDTLIQGNEFTGNGSAGYGLERGGVNIEHSERNTISHNRFARNAAGVHLWHDADPGLMGGPWAAANHQRTRDNTIVGNSFEGDATGIHLRAVESTRAGSNTFVGVEKPVLADAPNADGTSSQPVEVDDAGAPTPRVDAVLGALGSLVLGETRPVGARAPLAGRHNIVMGEYFPWDHRTPLVRRGADADGSHVYEVLGVSDPSLVTASVDGGSVRVEAAPAEPGAATGSPVHVRVVVSPDEGSDVTAYALTLGGPLEATLRGVIVRAEWWITAFDSGGVDPREQPDAWRQKQLTSTMAEHFTAPRLALRYGHGGVRGVAGLSPLTINVDAPLVDGPPPGNDHFGTIARTTLRLPPGRWRITTLSDDGVRVLVNGQAVIENWTWHGPTRDVGEFQVTPPLEGDETAATEIVVEHFELDGYSVLEVEIEPVR